MRTIIHVNQHAVRRGDDRCISVKQGRSNTYAGEVVIHGPSRVVHRPAKPLPCGAKVWIETEATVEVINPGPPALQRVGKTPTEARVKPKQGRVQDRAHLAFLRRLPCAVCGVEGGSDAAHIRYTDLRYKPNPGMGRKPDDKWTIPMCRGCHMTQHSMNERRFYEQRGFDPHKVAISLYEATGDERKARSILACL